jgi:hypothetical protein
MNRSTPAAQIALLVTFSRECDQTAILQSGGNECCTRCGRWDEMAIEITIRTPKNELSKRFTYGGHPRNLANWAMNVGLNMLRLEAQATE